MTKTTTAPAVAAAVPTAEKLCFKIVGVAPLVMHNGELANPMSEGAKALKRVTGKKAKTDADHAEIARVESETLRNRTAVRPFFTLRAQIYKLPSGQFLAINPTNSLYAQGDTAEQAANNFDGAFYKLQHSPPPEPSLPEPEPKPQPKRRAKAKKTTKK